MALRRNHLPRKVAEGARGHQGAPDSAILDLATRLEDAAILLRFGRSVVGSELHAFLRVPLGTQQQRATVARPPDDQTVATHLHAMRDTISMQSWIASPPDDQTVATHLHAMRDTISMQSWIASPPDNQTVATHHGRARASARLLLRSGHVDLTKLGLDEAEGGLERALGRRSPQREVVRE